MLLFCPIFTWRISHIVSFFKILFIFFNFLLHYNQFFLLLLLPYPPASHLPQPKLHPLLSKGKGFRGESTKFDILSWSRIKTLSPSPALRLSMTSPIGNKFQEAYSYIKDKPGPTAKDSLDSASFTTIFHIWRAWFSHVEIPQLSV